MDITNARLALRERSPLEVMDLTLLFVASHARAYAKVALVAIVPSFALAWAAAEAMGPSWGWAVAAILAAGAQLPFTALASRLVFDEKTRARVVLSQALRVTPFAMIAQAVAALGIGLGSLILVPGLWIATITLYLPEAIVLEGASFGTAFSRASRLARASVGDAIAAMIVGLALPAFAALLADLAGRSILEDIFELAPPASLSEAGISALALFGFFAAIPFAATARFLFYIDCRTRSEGWDVQTRFAALALRAEET